MSRNKKESKIDVNLDDLEFLFEETEKQSELGIGLDIDEELIKDAQQIDDNEFHDPDKAHTLFYSIQRIIISRIPKGTGRDLVLQQKTLFLNRGKNSDADSRTSPNRPFSTILSIVIDWANNYPNDKGFKLFSMIYDLNQKAGYEVKLKGLGKEWNTKMKKIANAANPKKKED